MSFLSRLNRNVIAFPLAALAALAMLAISEASYQDATSTLDALGQRATARNRLNNLTKALLDAETGQRGYLLTRRKEYLRPYQAALTSAREAIAWLTPYYAGDPRAARIMAEVVQESEAKLSELALTVELHDRGLTDGWREMLLTDIGREKMERMRLLGDQLLEFETARVATGRSSVYQTLMLNRIGVSAMAAVSLLALFMYLRQTVNLDRALKAEAQRVAGERDRLEREVSARTTQLKELAHHLQTIREDERAHLARELHDELGALLTAAKLDVARLKSRLGVAAAPDAIERIAHLNDTLNGGIALKRRIIEDLRPSSLNNLGLVAALEILLREFGDRSEIELDIHLEPVSLSASAQLTTYRLVQEALTNIAKYAKASRVVVRLGHDDEGAVVVSVRDDGIGFDMEAAQATTHGLVSMRYRVEAEGGSMSLDSGPGKGTLIKATIPAFSDGDSKQAAAAGLDQAA